jgi:hypothetical protein
MQHLIMNAVVVTPLRVFEGGWLLIEGDRIAAVGGKLRLARAEVTPVGC